MAGMPHHDVEVGQGRRVVDGRDSRVEVDALHAGGLQAIQIIDLQLGIPMGDPETVGEHILTAEDERRVIARGEAAGQSVDRAFHTGDELGRLRGQRTAGRKHGRRGQTYRQRRW